MRTRNETRWEVPFHRYASLDAFLQTPLQPGGNTIMHRGRDLDLLIENRGAATTLVVFNGELPANVWYLPYFTGRGIAKDLGLNLIAVSDPGLVQADLTVAWYLGDATTGPLYPVFVGVIGYALRQLGGQRTILYGASDGGYAATHYAPAFPDCTALVVNPRLLLDQPATSHQGLNYDLLIYQNFFDASSLNNQLLPFLNNAGHDPRCYLRFTNDGHGHTPIPPNTLRQLLHTLITTPQEPGAAGFTPAADIEKLTGQFLPEIADRLDTLNQAHQALGRERDALEVQQQRQHHKIQSLRARSDAFDKRLTLLNQKVAYLQGEPPFWRRLWHVLPRSFRDWIRRSR